MILNNLNKNFLFNLLFVFFIFLSDRFSKLYIINLEEKALSSTIYSSKFFDITLLWNQGIAFGLFSFDDKNIYNVISILILIIILILIFMTIKTDGFKKYSLLMILGGALGNFFDRIVYKAVPDFIDFHIGNFHWFIFNVADIFITIGVSFMILFEFLNFDKINKK